MAEEAFLWGIIPAAAPAGHGLPKLFVSDDLDETATCVMAALIRMNHGFHMKREPMVSNQLADRFQHKIYCQRGAEYILKDLLCKSIQDLRQIRKCSIVWKISNICQQNHPWAVVLKLTVKQVLRCPACFKRFCQKPIRISFPDRANGVIFTHQTLDFLYVHHNRRIQMEHPHVNTLGDYSARSDHLVRRSDVKRKFW